MTFRITTELDKHDKLTIGIYADVATRAEADRLIRAITASVELLPDPSPVDQGEEWGGEWVKTSDRLPPFGSIVAGYWAEERIGLKSGRRSTVKVEFNPLVGSVEFFDHPLGDMPLFPPTHWHPNKLFAGQNLPGPEVVS